MDSSNSIIDADANPTSVDLRERIKQLEGLPPFPATATQILAECEKPDFETATVIQLIECEPAVGVKVLKLANSPLYGRSSPIATIGHAVVLLGFRTVSQIAVSIAAGSMFETGDPAVAEIRKETFFKSLACATSARLIARELSAGNPDEAFLSGIMHDVGKLVFLDLAKEPYCDILKVEPDDSTQMEREQFGISHPQAGNVCTTFWGLPAQINLAISNHHFRFDEMEHKLSQSVIAANYFARIWGEEEETGDLTESESEIDANLSQAQNASLQAEYIDQFAAISEICAI